MATACEPGQNATLLVDGSIYWTGKGVVTYSINVVPVNTLEWWYFQANYIPGGGAFLLREKNPQGTILTTQMFAPDVHEYIVYQSQPSFQYIPPTDNFTDNGYYLIGEGYSYSNALSPGSSYFQSLPQRRLPYTHKPYKLTINGGV